jgi:hypothetical protein
MLFMMDLSLNGSGLGGKLLFRIPTLTPKFMAAVAR